MKSWGKWLILSLVVNLAFAGAALMLVKKKGGWSFVRGKAQSAMGVKRPCATAAQTKATVYESLIISPGDTVILGDSLVDFGEWGESFNSVRVKNRGIAGDTTADVQKRVGAIIAGRPTNVILWCGVNDLQRGISYEDTVKEYKLMIARLVATAPAIKVWILPVLPVNREKYAKTVLSEHPRITEPTMESVIRFNGFLSRLSGPQVTFVPLPNLSNRDGILEQHTLDGLHLTGSGLREVTLALKGAGLEP